MKFPNHTFLVTILFVLFIAPAFVQTKYEFRYTFCNQTFTVIDCIATDGDGLGEYVDVDYDNDLVTYQYDAFPQDPSESKDPVLEGIVDSADPLPAASYFYRTNLRDGSEMLQGWLLINY